MAECCIAQGLGHQQVWVVEHLRGVGLVPLPTNSSTAAERFGASATKGEAELIRQTLHRLHRDGIITVERRGRGIDKFDVGISMIEDMFRTWGVPAPGLTAPLTAVVEIVGGAMLVLGLGTRFAAMALSVVMIGALIYVKQDLGIISSEPMPGAELDLAMLAGLVAIIVLGPGRASLDDQLGIEPTDSAREREPALV